MSERDKYVALRALDTELVATPPTPIAVKLIAIGADPAQVELSISIVLPVVAATSRSELGAAVARIVGGAVTLDRIRQAVHADFRTAHTAAIAEATETLGDPPP